MKTIISIIAVSIVAGLAIAGEPTTEQILLQMEHLPEWKEYTEIVAIELKESTTELYSELFVAEIDGVVLIEAGARYKIIRQEAEDGRVHTYVMVERFCGAEPEVYSLLHFNIIKK